MGAYLSVMDESWPPKPKWKVDEVPDMTGKVALVTGGTSGIGKKVAKVLLLRGAKVYITARDSRKAQDTVKELSEATKHTPGLLVLDLSDLGSVKTAAEDFLRNEKELHILFNNAGIMGVPSDQVTKEGYDLQFATNVLGPFLLTELLLPTLISTSSRSNGFKARIVNMTSEYHFLSKVDFNKLRDTPARRKTAPQDLYAQSKLGNVIFATELARRYGDQGIVSTCINPGNIRTNLQRHLPTITGKIFGLMLYPLENGILSPLYAATTEEGASLNGKYLKPFARVGQASKGSQDPKVGKELWTWMEEQTKSYTSSEESTSAAPPA